jgi:hypothetical protein
MRTMERAAFMTAWREKKLRGLLMVATGASGSAATRIETFVVSTGTYAYGGSPDLDALFQQQAVERDRSKRQALLHQIQRLMTGVTAKVGQILIARAGNSRARLLILVMVLVALLAAAARAGDGLRWFVIDMLPVNMVDATGLLAIRDVFDTLRSRGGVGAAGRETEWADWAAQRGVSQALAGIRFFPTLRQAASAFREERDAASERPGSPPAP